MKVSSLLDVIADIGGVGCTLALLVNLVLLLLLPGHTLSIYEHHIWALEGEIGLVAIIGLLLFIQICAEDIKEKGAKSWWRDR